MSERKRQSVGLSSDVEEGSILLSLARARFELAVHDQLQSLSIAFKARCASLIRDFLALNHHSPRVML